jgi:hypothetical protein
LAFNLAGGLGELAQEHWADANPFIMLNEEERSFGFLQKNQKAFKEGLTIQGKKKHAVRIASPRQKTKQSLLHATRPDTPLGGETRSDSF